MDENSDGGAYLKILSRGGLKVGSPALNDYVAMGFAILGARKSDVPERKAGEHILHKFLSQDEYGGFTCPIHQSAMCTKTNRIITNVFFNNQRKRSTESVVTNRLAALKKPKRAKSDDAYRCK